MTKQNRIYGPVPSRRLGMSLGVDLIPMKCCPFDCIYCQLGHTQTKTDVRSAYYPREELLFEIEKRLNTCSHMDYITLAGCGEPTLYEGFGDLIGDIKAKTQVPVALLTNGALFTDPVVRSEAAKADLVLPSLDAGDEESFRYINRPLWKLFLQDIIGGLETFRQEYEGPIWLEIMLLAGFSEVTQRLQALAEACRRIGPDRIQLNTPVRPPACNVVEPIPLVRLESYCSLFSPAAEVIADFPWSKSTVTIGDDERSSAILEMLKRRPCTLDDIDISMGLNPNETLKLLQALESRGMIHRLERSGRNFFWTPQKAESIAHLSP